MNKQKSIMHQIMLTGLALFISLIATSASAVTFGYSGSGTFSSPDPSNVPADPNYDPGVILNGIGTSTITYGSGSSSLQFVAEQDAASPTLALLVAGDTLKLGEFNYTNGTSAQGTSLNGVSLDMGLSQCDLGLLGFGAGYECGGVSNNNPQPDTDPNFDGTLDIILFNTVNTGDLVGDSDAFCFTLGGAAATVPGPDPDGAGPLTSTLFGACGWAQEGATNAAFALNVQLGSMYGFSLEALSPDTLVTQIVKYSDTSIVLFDPTGNGIYIPEPTTLALFGIGLLGFGLRKRKI